MPKIFVSYRRSDRPGFAARLSDHLESCFGDKNVFRDREGIDSGQDFDVVLERALRKSKVLVVLIGPNWLYEDGLGDKSSRLFDDGDWVRREIEIALERDKEIIPVLLDGVDIPRSDQVPESMARFCKKQIHKLDDERWKYDVGRLVERLESILGIKAKKQFNKPKKKSKLPLLLGGAVTAILVAGVLVNQLEPAPRPVNEPRVAITNPTSDNLRQKSSLIIGSANVVEPVVEPTVERSASPRDISGFWYEPEDEYFYQIEQSGDAYQIVAYDYDMTVAGSGQGYWSDGKIVYELDEDGNGTYAGEAQLSADGTQLIARVRDPYGDSDTYVLKKVTEEQLGERITQQYQAGSMSGAQTANIFQYDSQSSLNEAYLLMLQEQYNQQARELINSLGQ